MNKIIALKTLSHEGIFEWRRLLFHRAHRICINTKLLPRSNLHDFVTRHDCYG